MHQWGSRHRLSPQTLAVLAEQGITSLDVLRHLNPSDVIEAFQTTELLPPGQCMLLKKALQEVRGETGEATPAMGGGRGRGGEAGRGVGFEAAAPPVYHNVTKGTPHHVKYPSVEGTS